MKRSVDAVESAGIYYRSQLEALLPKGRKIIATQSGQAVIPLYRSKFNSDGILELVEDGSHDLYAEIQSHAASTDMNLILGRYFSGDPSALSRVQGIYADISEMPRNIHEAMSLMDNARKDFESLPPSIKEKFNNDPNQFVASLGSDDWLEKMQLSPSDSSVSSSDSSAAAFSEASASNAKEE